VHLLAREQVRALSLFFSYGFRFLTVDTMMMRNDDAEKSTLSLDELRPIYGPYVVPQSIMPYSNIIHSNDMLIHVSVIGAYHGGRNR
jgi:hypothetical protein